MTDTTLLYRQINASWVQEGRVTSQAFRPMPKDGKRLSVYDGDQVDANEAWTHYTQTLGFDSVGVLAVTVAECSEQDLSAEPDPAPFPSHAVIRFDSCTTNGQVERKAKALNSRATARSWQFRVEADA